MTGYCGCRICNGEGPFDMTEEEYAEWAEAQIQNALIPEDFMVGMDPGKDSRTVRVCGRCNAEFAGDACPCGFVPVVPNA
jgi:hypothetical protein